MRNGNILLVEDDPDDAELTVDVFRQNHPANGIVVVRNGVEALDYLRRRGKFAQRAGGDPLVAIVDLHMPKLNGLELLRAIKSDWRLRHIPVVIMTSSAEEVDVKESYRWGANAYVVKPVQFDDFKESVLATGKFWAAANERPRKQIWDDEYC